MADQKRQLNVPLDPELAEAVHRAAHRAYRSCPISGEYSSDEMVIRDGKAVVEFNEEEMNSNHVMPAKDLASALGVSEMDLPHLAHERRLPFFVSGAGGFAIMSRDLGQWRAAVQQAGCGGE